MRFIKVRIIIVAIIIAFLFFLVSCHNPASPEKTADAALYSDNGTWSDSVTAIQNMVTWAGYTIAQVKAVHINNGDLEHFSVLYVPGGDFDQYARDISGKGKDNIRNFVRKGGGYIGICGGAYFAAEVMRWQGSQLPYASLNIFPGTSNGPLNDIILYPNYAMTEIMIDHTHPITQSEPDTLWMLYYWGPSLVPSGNVTVLGRYAKNGFPMMVAFEYGAGRVFLIGTHPEIEENSDRDGTNFGNELVDNDSEWELLRKALNWTLKK